MTKEKKPVERVLNVLPSRDREKDWSFSSAVAANVLKPETPEPHIDITKLKPLPSVDLRDDSWWKIADQGNSGACVGFACADVLWWHLVKRGKLNNSSDRPSRRFLWMSSKETDIYTTYPTTFLELPGTYIKSCLDVTRKYGCVLEAVLPFDPEVLSHLRQDVFFAQAAKLKIAGYYGLRDPNSSWPATKASWKVWLSFGGGPIITRLDIDDTWDNASNAQGLLETYHPKTTRGGHAVSIVGYTKEDRFIIRNSWGPAFGKDGYAYASDAYTNAAFTEAYGISLT